MMTRLFVLIAVFMSMMGIAEIIPQLVQVYRERYQKSLGLTARELDKFFINIKPTKIMIGAVVLGAAVGALTTSWVIAVILSLCGIFAPKLILVIWKDIRSTQFDAQLMDALLLLNNSLRSGLDIAAGIERISTTLKAPISEEFGLVLNAYRLGTPLEVALIDLTSRIRSRTLETVVYAVSIQRETGGNIIKTFDQLVTTIREESKLQKKVKAMTSQGRTQIYFLAGFPWVLGGVFFILSPDLMRPAIVNPWGQVTIVFLIIWEIIGISVTKKIVTVDV